MGTNRRLGHVVQIVCACDPDNSHPDMIALATVGRCLGDLHEVFVAIWRS
jgi:hypothetical protein